jgi:hypothetical protein
MTLMFGFFFYFLLMVHSMYFESRLFLLTKFIDLNFKY